MANFQVFCKDNFIKHYSPISEGWKPSQGFRKFGFFSHPPWKVFGKFCTWSEFRVTHHVLSSLLPRKTFHSALKSYKIFLVEIKVLQLFIVTFEDFHLCKWFISDQNKCTNWIFIEMQKNGIFFSWAKMLTNHCALWFWKENVGFKRCYFIEVQFNFPL